MISAIFLANFLDIAKKVCTFVQYLQAVAKSIVSSRQYPSSLFTWSSFDPFFQYLSTVSYSF